jgi:hypothetical protein
VSTPEGRAKDTAVPSAKKDCPVCGKSVDWLRNGSAPTKHRFGEGECLGGYWNRLDHRLALRWKTREALEHWEYLRGRQPALP